MVHTYIRYLLVIVGILVLFDSCEDKHAAYYTGVVEGETCSLSSPTSDRLVALSVDEGDFIRKGDKIGQIDAESLAIRKKELETSVDQIALEEKSNEIQLDQAGKNLSYYNTLYTKNRDLLLNKAVSEQNVRDSELQVIKWTDNRKSIDVQQNLLESKKDSLSLQIRQLDDQIADTILVSPISGFVDKIYYNQGEFVPAFHAVTDIVDLKNIWCYIYVSSDAVSVIQPGMSVTVKMEQQTFTGKVAHINANAEFTPKNILTPDNKNSMVYGIKISIQNRNSILKIGQPVDIYPEAKNGKR